MYAIIKASGKQYRVEPGTEFETDRLPGEPGQSVNLDNSVLLLRTDDAVKIGTPVVPGASVELQIVEHLRGDKITVFKKKRRANYRRKKGHRQELTALRITEILTDGKKPSKQAAKSEPKKAEKKPAEAAEAKPAAKKVAAKPARKPAAKAEKRATRKPAAKPKKK